MSRHYTTDTSKVRYTQLTWRPCLYDEHGRDISDRAVLSDMPNRWVGVWQLVPSWTPQHYDDVIMGMMASQITSLTVVYPTFYSGAHQSKHQSSTPLAFVWGIHRGPVNSTQKWPVTRNMFPFDDVIMPCLEDEQAWDNSCSSGLGSFNLLMAITGDVWIIPSFRIWGYVLHVDHISFVIANCGQHQWAIPSLFSIIL